MKRSEILENRKKVIEFLKQPERLKYAGALVDYQNHEARCCLGHMCESLIPETKEYKPNQFNEDILYTNYQGEQVYAPPLLIKKLGLHDGAGGVLATNASILGTNYTSLAEVNDNTLITPQEIGAYLESVLEGGDDTPWKSISSYKE